MIAIAFELIVSRYHATQWGRHANEGVPEWPPSPWRILRSLVATWMRTLPDIPPEKVVPVLEQLATEPPGFFLPPAVPAHTRHYMPWDKKGPGDRTLVLDPFVATAPNGAVVAIWSGIEPTVDQRDTLGSILGNMSYFGRAESWCSASLVDSAPQLNCYPLDSGLAPPPGDWDIVRVLTPSHPLRLAELCVETSDLRRKGRIDPPGAHWQLYARRAECFAPEDARRDRRRSAARRPQVVRYAVSAKVPPLLTDTLRVAELARRGAMAWYGRLNQGRASRLLSGKNPDGSPLEGHGHAFYLPTDEDDDGRLDHLTVLARDSFHDDDVEALASVRTLNPGDARPELPLVFQGSGTIGEFENDFPPHHPLFGKGRVWESATPFVLTRHLKWRGPKDPSGRPTRLVDGPRDQVLRELANHGVGDVPAEITVLDRPRKPEGWREVRSLEFHRWRSNRGIQGQGAYAFQLRFREPVVGPIVLGYACHFGLGLFVPEPLEEEMEGA